MDYITTISKALTRARDTRTPIEEFPGELPKTIDDAYAIQAACAKNTGKAIVGWKVAGMPPNMPGTWNVAKLVGPAFEGTIHKIKSGDTVELPIYAGGFAAVEPEYVAVLGDIPDRDVTLEDMDDVVSSLHIGMELAASTLIHANKIGPAAIISAMGLNGGVIVGPEIPKDADLTKVEVSCTIDCDLAGKKSTGAGMAGPYGSVVFAINHLRAQGIAIPPGTVISTGAITGVHSADDGSRSHIVYDGLGDFFVELKAH